MGSRRVLLAWELGVGYGHSTKLARVGARLRAAGHEVVAACSRPYFSAPLVEAGIPVIAAPETTPPDYRTIPASATLTDSLAQAGLLDPRAMQRSLAGWRAILDRVRPDLVVLDYAPMATLAARNRALRIQTGVGFCLPPQELTAFPLLHTLMPPLARDEDMLAAVNRALAAEGSDGIDRVGALFEGNDAFVTTFPLLDPYADLRQRPADGPLMTEPMRERRADAAGIFAYLNGDGLARPGVLAALCVLGPMLEIYPPGATPACLAALRAAGARVYGEPQRLSVVLARTRLVLHQGNAGIAADALAAGVPQYVLCQHVEHYLNGEAIAAAGVARSRPLFDPRYVPDPTDILAFAEDQDAAHVALAAGRIHRALLEQRPPLEHLVARCLALLSA
ncbi:hypothetical protein ABLE88_03440 [Xanthobacter sp. KR7-225]